MINYVSCFQIQGAPLFQSPTQGLACIFIFAGGRSTFFFSFTLLSILFFFLLFFTFLKPLLLLYPAFLFVLIIPLSYQYGVNTLPSVTFFA